MESTNFTALRHPAPPLIGLAIVALVALAAGAAYVWSERRAFARLDDDVGHQMELYAGVLEQDLGNNADLAGILDLDFQALALIDAPGDAALSQALNRRLTRFVARSGVLNASIVDAQRRVLASSDWYRPDAVTEHAADQEPCAVEGLAGQPVQRFSANPRTGAPEVCFARPVRRGGLTLGVVTVRTSLQPIEVTWIDSAFRAESEKPLIVDARGVVILSSVPTWKQRSLASLMRPPSQSGDDVELVQVPDLKASGMEMQVLHERPLSRMGWRLLILSNARAVWAEARTVAWGAGAIAVSLSLFLLLMLQRHRVAKQKLAARAALQRAHDELEDKVLQRTAQLEATNASLRHEVAERQRAEETMRHAQEELVHAGKLALLGQLSAGISHELGQPLTALRALAQNGHVLLERDQPQQARENFDSILGLAERMGRITSQLKSFARKNSPESRSLPLVVAVRNAHHVLSQRLSAEKMAVVLRIPPDLEVRCDFYGLEQVLVNLLSNSMDAMRNTLFGSITVAASTEAERVVVRVSDTGPGIPAELGAHLFQPFFTTKAPGEGLGLGLVISSQIVRDFGGTLRVVPSPDGAVFEFDLAVGGRCSMASKSP